MIDPKTGAAVTDPQQSAEALLLPMGGYKGAGLALMLGLLAGTLNGALFGRDCVDFNADPGTVTNTGQFVIALDPSRFQPLEQFKAEVDRHMRELAQFARRCRATTRAAARRAARQAPRRPLGQRPRAAAGIAGAARQAGRRIVDQAAGARASARTHRHAERHAIAFAGFRFSERTRITYMPHLLRLDRRESSIPVAMRDDQGRTIGALLPAMATAVGRYRRERNNRYVKIDEIGSKRNCPFLLFVLCCASVISAIHHAIMCPSENTYDRIQAGQWVVASMYWEDKLVSTGKKFNPIGWHAAHKTLPIGTLIRVSNPKNSRSINVTINDRGPFTPDRDLDLESRGRAHYWDFKGCGTVYMEVLSIPPVTNQSTACRGKFVCSERRQRQLCGPGGMLV